MAIFNSKLLNYQRVATSFQLNIWMVRWVEYMERLVELLR